MGDSRRKREKRRDKGDEEGEEKEEREGKGVWRRRSSNICVQHAIQITFLSLANCGLHSLVHSPKKYATICAERCARNKRGKESAAETAAGTLRYWYSKQHTHAHTQKEQ